MKALAITAALLVAGCGHPWRNGAIANGVVVGAASTCAFECGAGVGRSVSDVVLVIEAIIVAATIPVAAVGIGAAIGEESK